MRGEWTISCIPVSMLKTLFREPLVRRFLAVFAARLDRVAPVMTSSSIRKLRDMDAKSS